MLTNLNTKFYSEDKILTESACLSTDTKPTEGIKNGSICIEMDTGKIYMFNEAGTEWLEVAGA